VHKIDCSKFVEPDIFLFCILFYFRTTTNNNMDDNAASSAPAQQQEQQGSGEQQHHSNVYQDDCIEVIVVTSMGATGNTLILDLQKSRNMSGSGGNSSSNENILAQFANTNHQGYPHNAVCLLPYYEAIVASPCLDKSCINIYDIRRVSVVVVLFKKFLCFCLADFLSCCFFLVV